VPEVQAPFTFAGRMGTFRLDLTSPWRGEGGRRDLLAKNLPNARGGVLLYIRYIGMCRPKGYGF